MHFIGFYDYTVILTYISLISSLIGMTFAYKGNLFLATLCLMLSGICDMFDGIVARSKKNRTHDEKNFGIQLDSLCDVVCFGIYPAVMLYFSGVNTLFGLAGLIFYSLCAVIRLAFFNVLETKRQSAEDGCAKEYRGLPVTTAAIIFPIFFFISPWISPSLSLLTAHGLPYITGFLFILDFRVPKIDFVKLLQNKNKWRFNLLGGCWYTVTYLVAVSNTL